MGWSQYHCTWASGQATEESPLPPENTSTTQEQLSNVNILEYSGIFWNILEYYGIFQIIVIPLYSRVFQNVRKYSKVFKNIQKYF